MVLMAAADAPPRTVGVDEAGQTSVGGDDLLEIRVDDVPLPKNRRDAQWSTS